ncbi:hypothetical protein X739_07100 [Mesorhizobium sp. LNHC220B00]|nr:hypothetical protein X739_07100 [Mesorhizobium sp. LNHC220B00]
MDPPAANEGRPSFAGDVSKLASNRMKYLRSRSVEAGSLKT